jgi:hypothetical protein
LTDWKGPFTREEYLERATEHERAAATGLAVGPNLAYVRTFQACAAALRIAASAVSDSRTGDLKEIESTRRLASMRQIHLAIELLHRGEFEAAITLAGAAEGILPEPTKPYLRTKQEALVKTLLKDTEGATGVNDFINWAKHGEANYVPKEKARLPEFEVILVISRAISKFIALYDGHTERMKAFEEWAIKRLQDDKKPT